MPSKWDVLNKSWHYADGYGQEGDDYGLMRYEAFAAADQAAIFQLIAAPGID